MNKKFYRRIKIISLVLSMMVVPFTGMAQTAKKPQAPKSISQGEKVATLLAKIDTLMTINNELLNHLEINTSLKGRYKLYQTDNNYNFLMLDTKTGVIEQVQWSFDSDKEFSCTINEDDLSFWGYGSGTFELYPTKNIWTYILIDKTDGRKWHVQWGFKEGERWIRRIY